MNGDAPLNLFRQQQVNRRRTAWLVLGFVLFFAWLGFGGDFIYYLYTAHGPPAAQHHVWWFGFVHPGMVGARLPGCAAGFHAAMAAMFEGSGRVGAMGAGGWYHEPASKCAAPALLLNAVLPNC